MSQMSRETGKTKKSILMTPDPFHTPGYGGFCPQFKYQIGETFGRTTSRLLTDQGVASSGRLVLANNQPAESSYNLHDAQRRSLIQTRTQSWGDQKLVEKMVPGYTGFIPKSQHYFGKRYAENCTNAISDFEGDQRTDKGKTNNLRVTEALQSGKIPMDPNNPHLPEIKTSHMTPLRPIASEHEPYIPSNYPHHAMSPYYMTNSNPNKKYMSGYTGFVPRARGMLGMGYPLITHVALNEFTDNLKHNKNINSLPIKIHREVDPTVSNMKIYPTETGLVPHYTGHIPGEKFRYGNTFGHSTRNAMTNRRTAIGAL